MHKEMVEIDKCNLYMVCTCGITWKIPSSRGKGLSSFNFRCDSPKGCNRFIHFSVIDNRITCVSGIDKWWIKEIF